MSIDVARSVEAAGFRSAARRLVARPWQSALMLLMMGAAVGSSTAVFATVRSSLLASLPYSDSQNIIRVWFGEDGDGHGGVMPSEFAELQQAAPPDILIGAYRFTSSAVIAGQRSESALPVALVTPTLLDVLGMTPTCGARDRLDAATAARDGVIVTLEFARRVLDPLDCGANVTVSVDGVPRRVLGTLPAGFVLPEQAVDLVIPFDSSATLAKVANGFSVHVVPVRVLARFPDSSSIDQSARLLRQRLAASRRVIHTASLESDSRRLVRTPLLLFQAATILIVLSAAASLAQLFLARAKDRTNEFQVRTALGARPGALALAAIAEPLLLMLPSLAASVLFYGVTAQLVDSALAQLPGFVANADVHPVVVAFALAAFLFCGCLSVVPSCVFAGRFATRTSTPTAMARTSSQTSRMLLAAQILVASASLTLSWFLATSTARLLGRDLGFDASRVSFVEVHLAGRDAHERALQSQALLDSMGAELRGSAVSTGSTLPSHERTQVKIRSVTGDGATVTPGYTDIVFVSDDYFRALGIRRSDAGYPKLAADGAVVNVEFALKFLRSTSGARTIYVGDHAYPVVDIVADVLPNGPRSASIPTIYIRQADLHEDLGPSMASALSTVFVIIKDAKNPQAVRDRLTVELGRFGFVSSVGATVRELKPFIDRETRPARALTAAVVAAGAVAGVLGSMAFAGILAQALGACRREFGIRLALGATRSSLALTLVNSMFVPALGGAGSGLLGAGVLAHLAESQLYEVSASALWPYPLALATLCLCLMLASVRVLLICHRLDPATELRSS